MRGDRADGDAEMEADRGSIQEAFVRVEDARFLREVGQTYGTHFEFVQDISHSSSSMAYAGIRSS